MKVRNEDMIGMKFGRLTVVNRIEDYVTPSGTHFPKFHCECDCGGCKDVLKYSLTRGATTSCGCAWREAIKSMWEDEERRKELNAWKSTNEHYKEIIRRQLEERRKDPEWRRKQREACQTPEFREKIRISALKHADELRERSLKHGVWSRHPKLARTIWNHWIWCYRPQTRCYKIYGARGFKFSPCWLLPDGFPDFVTIENWCVNNGWDEDAKDICFEKDYLCNQLRVKEIGPDTVRFVTTGENKSKECRYVE